MRPCLPPRTRPTFPTDPTDFHTYTTMPVFLLWRAQILPPHLQWLLLLPVLASAYGYSQTNAKSDDGFFIGFPSLWNVVAFYVYFLRSRSPRLS